MALQVLRYGVSVFNIGCISFVRLAILPIRQMLWLLVPKPKYDFVMISVQLHRIVLVKIRQISK